MKSVSRQQRIANRIVAKAKKAGGYWDNDEVAKVLSGIDLKGLGRDVKRGKAGPDEIEEVAQSLTEIAEGFRDWMGSQ